MINQYKTRRQRADRRTIKSAAGKPITNAPAVVAAETQNVRHPTANASF
jgi:hypothetical protein